MVNAPINKRDFLKKVAFLSAGLAGTVAVASWMRRSQVSFSEGKTLGSEYKDHNKETTLTASTDLTPRKEGSESDNMIKKLELSDAEWKKRLTDEQYYILRKEGTERPFTSELNNEKRKGVFHCVGCDLELFTSESKYDSGTGWPSFFTHIEGHFETKDDRKLLLKRTEYHCARCGGHHGHVFNDGPAPTYERWCNNGVALKFVPTKV